MKAKVFDFLSMYLWYFRDVPPASAMDHVFGYTVAIDYTARDLMANNGGIVKLKPGHCVLGISCTVPNYWYTHFARDISL